MFSTELYKQLADKFFIIAERVGVPTPLFSAFKIKQGVSVTYVLHYNPTLPFLSCVIAYQPQKSESRMVYIEVRTLIQ